MKHTLSKLVLIAVFLAPFSLAQAQILPPVAFFDGNTATLQVPLVFVNGEAHYVEMSLSDPDTLTFTVELDTLVNIHPDGRNDGKVTNDIVGEWELSEEGADTQLFINADSTFRLTEGANEGDECPLGGDETGTFRFTIFTGLFKPIFEVDENNDCGLSGAGKILRLYRDGNTLTIQLDDDGNDLGIFTRI